MSEWFYLVFHSYCSYIKNMLVIIVESGHCNSSSSPGWGYFLFTLQVKDNIDNIKIFCKTDNSCLYHSAHSSTQILDKRLHIEMTVLREMLERKEITEISWVPTDTQIADPLTKKGVPSFKILGFMSELKESSV